MNGINFDLRKLDIWAKKWLITINPTKTAAMLFSLKQVPQRIPYLFLGEQVIKFVDLNNSCWLNWTRHIDELVTKCTRRIRILRQFKYRWIRNVLKICYKIYISPIIEYGNIINDSCSDSDSQKLEQLQIDVAHIAVGTKRGMSHEWILLELGWQMLSTRRIIAKGIKMFQFKNGLHWIILPIFSDNLIFLAVSTPEVFQQGSLQSHCAEGHYINVFWD